MARRDMVITEIDRLYAVINEIRAEYDNLSEKMARDFMDGDVLSDTEQERFRVLYNLLKIYNGGNEE